MPKGNRGLPAQAGFIKLILLIVIALIVLGLFGYNLRTIVNSPTVRENLAFVWNLIVTGCNWVVDHVKALFGK